MKIFLSAIICLCAVMHVHATTLYWVGPLNGKWSDAKNWSLTGAPGSGGAGVPGSADAAVFDFAHTSLSTSKVNLDVSPLISALRIETKTSVNLYTSAPTNLIILQQFSLAGSLTDSTVENVKFNVLLNSSTNSILPAAGGSQANWIFSGRVPVSNGAGAYFTMSLNSLLTAGIGAYIVFRNNTAPIVSSKSSLKFAAGSHYILENNLDATLPAATWDGDLYSPTPASFAAPAAEIQINGNAKTIKHAAGAYYSNIKVDLFSLSSDADFSLPDGTVIEYRLVIQNTNNRTLTLLSATGPSTEIKVNIGTAEDPMHIPIGGLFINGSNSKVALARAPASSNLSYKLSVQRFQQTGGNFSLQDGDANYTGTSTLVVRTDMIESAGSFVTNCAATNATVKFIVEIDGPAHVDHPGGPIFTGQFIDMSSGRIDKNNNMVTLRMAQTPFNYTYLDQLYSSPLGVTLMHPLSVGRLELNGGPIFTQDANFVEITNPSPSAVQIMGKNSYVNGPVKRWVNYAGPVMFPTGKGTRLDFHLDTIVIIPNSPVTSLYQAEYFNTGYPDQSVQFPFKTVSSNEYWNVFRFSGADAQIKLTLDGAVPGATASNNLVVALYNSSGKWINEQGTTLSPGNASSGSVVSKVLSVFGPLTFGCINVFKPIPLSITGTAMHSTAAEVNMDLISLAPTIVTGSATLQINARADGKLEMLITDLAGRTWRKQVIPVKAGSSTSTLNLHDLPAGVYQLSGRMNMGTNIVTRFIKQ